MLSMRKILAREINGLPYVVHQIGDGQWQIVIENCPRHPAGYSFAAVYGSYDEAYETLQHWPAQDAAYGSEWAGDDTGTATMAYFED